jgi:phosphoribosyl-ATP pyrophosphohydrolase/phosphoribosyl-AMP cyclohydrolase
MVNEPSENARPEASRNGKDDGTAPDYSGGAALPLVLFDRNGKIADIGLMNEKGFRKSIERGTLWVVNVETGRLLPYREGSSFTGLVKTERWYSAVLHDETNARTASEDAAASGTAPGPRPDLERPEMSPAENQAAADASVLSELAELLKIRKSELPEGSYTAHLFRSGGADSGRNAGRGDLRGRGSRVPLARAPDGARDRCERDLRGTPKATLTLRKYITGKGGLCFPIC